MQAINTVFSLSFKYGWENLANPGRILLIILYLLVGLVLLIKGGDWFVDGAVWFAEKFKIPKLVIGATIVSIATTMPEFLVSIFAAIEGAQGAAGSSGAVDMATGNAIGSVICNCGLILSLSMLLRPINVDKKSIIIKPSILLFAIVLFWIFSIDRNLYVWEAVLMLLVLVGFFLENVLEAKADMKVQAQMAVGTSIPVAQVPSEETKESEEHGKKEPVSEAKPKKKGAELWKNIGLFIIGIAAIVVGAQLLVDNATELAVEMGVSNKIIAVTIVAIGTSLPELITAIVSIVKKQSDLSVGNIIGANIIDQTLILPVCSFIYGKALPVFDSTMYLDLPFALAITLVATVPSMFTKKLSRWQGAVGLCLYISYLTLYFIYF